MISCCRCSCGTWDWWSCIFCGGGTSILQGAWISHHAEGGLWWRWERNEGCEGGKCKLCMAKYNICVLVHFLFGGRLLFITKKQNKKENTINPPGKSASKSCILDPIPTHFLKTIIDDMLPMLTKIINMSLQQGSFPDVWKTAIVTPLLKKHGLPLESINYRPISNLSYVSKLIESASMEQFADHLARYSLSYDSNSAYKKGHSTETILTKVHSDILMEMDNRNVVLLIMLDLSAAFDTVDYKTMFQILDNKFGLNNNVINWFQSYLNNRKIQVRVGNELSEPFPLDCGVPQGSCTGPTLFLSYLSSLYDVITRHLPSVHVGGYADDHQLYLSFKPGKPEDELLAIQAIN